MLGWCPRTNIWSCPYSRQEQVIGWLTHRTTAILARRPCDVIMTSRNLVSGGCLIGLYDAVVAGDWMVPSKRTRKTRRWHSRTSGSRTSSRNKLRCAKKTVTNIKTRVFLFIQASYPTVQKTKCFLQFSQFFPSNELTKNYFVLSGHFTDFVSWRNSSGVVLLSWTQRMPNRMPIRVTPTSCTTILLFLFLSIGFGSNLFIARAILIGTNLRITWCFKFMFMFLGLEHKVNFMKACRFYFRTSVEPKKSYYFTIKFWARLNWFKLKKRWILKRFQ